LQNTPPPFVDAQNKGLFYGVWGLLGLHVLVWMLAHGIADSNLDGYADMLENYAWGQNLAWGSAKHPPLFAWVTGLWFVVFPTLDSFYYLLSYVNVAVGLLGVHRLAVAVRLPNLALPAVLLLCMAFPYSTLASKFNANAILLSLWPWVAVAWLHSVQRSGRSGWLWSVALGLLSAMAMLGKYYSGVFLLGIFLAAFASKEGRLWFVTVKPWLALLVFGLSLLPHLQWLRAHDFVTLLYVGEQGSGDGTDWRQVFRFAMAPMAYWLLPWLLSAWLYAPGQPSFRQRLIGFPVRLICCWRPQGWADTLFWLAMLPWLITLVFGATGFVALSLPWAIPVGFGFSLLWLRNLSTAEADVPRITAQLRLAMMGWCALVLIISPWYLWHQAKDGTENHYLPRREAARELLKGWQERHPAQPLRWVGGAWAENALLAFYGDPSIQVIPGVPDQFPATVNPLPSWQLQGGMLLCPLGPVEKPIATDCPQHMQAWLDANGHPAQAIRVTVQSQGMRFTKHMPFAYVAYDYLPIRP
jgi:hypothetical protein